MPSFPARTANSPYRARTRPALARLVDEVCGTTARLIAYLMALALIAIGGIVLWQHLPEIAAAVDPIEIYQAVLHPEGDGQEVPGRSGAVAAPSLPGATGRWTPAICGCAAGYDHPGASCSASRHRGLWQ